MTAPKLCPAGQFGTEFGKTTQNEACKPCPINVSHLLAGWAWCIPL